MKKWIAGILCLAVVFLTACAAKTPEGLDRPAGSEGSETGEELRLIATSASVCGIMDQLELELIGVPDSSAELPERYHDVPRIGLPMSPDLELIKTLKPTDVIGPNALQYDLEPKYKSAGISATFLNLTSVEGMLESIRSLGVKYDREAQAEELLQAYKNYIKAYHQRTADIEKPKVLVLMGMPGAYMVATEASYVGSLVSLAGGENVFPGEGEAFLTLNTEAISKTDPDVILRAAHGMPEEVKESFQKEFRENDVWKHFRAVQEDRVYDLDYDLFGMSATLRYSQALDALYDMLYGSAS